MSANVTGARGAGRAHGDIDAVVFDYGGVLAEVRTPEDGFGIMAGIIRAALPSTTLTVADIETDLMFGWRAYDGWKRAQSRSRQPVELAQTAFWELVTCDWDAPERAAVAAQATVLTRELELTVIQRPASSASASVLKALRAAGIKTALASNCLSGDAARVQLSADGLLDLFDVMVFSNEIGYRKPGPLLLLHALTAVGVSPSAACFVGDRLDRDILAARRAEFQLCILKTAKTGSGTALRGVVADAVIDELGELLPLIGLVEKAAAPDER